MYRFHLWGWVGLAVLSRMCGEWPDLIRDARERSAHGLTSLGNEAGDPVSWGVWRGALGADPCMIWGVEQAGGGGR